MKNKKNKKNVEAPASTVETQVASQQSAPVEAPPKTIEARLQEAFPLEQIRVVTVTDRIVDPKTFDVMQGIKLNVNGRDIKMKWDVNAAAQHQSATGVSFEDIVVNAVVGTLTAWGTCRMTIIQ